MFIKANYATVTSSSTKLSIDDSYFEDSRNTLCENQMSNKVSKFKEENMLVKTKKLDSSYKIITFSIYIKTFSSTFL